MADKFKDEMKKVLLSKKQEILKNLASKGDSFKSLLDDVDPKDEADIAADDIDGKMLESMSREDMNKLNLIDAALSRIQSGRYGLCMKCGQKIAEARLRAIPYAVLCINCKSQDERFNR